MGKVKPLSAWTYYRRHKRGTLLLVGLIGLMTLGVCVMVRLPATILSHVLFVQRKDEFGTLHAIGHSRRWLVPRTTRETVGLIAMAWLLGAALCGVGLAYIQAVLFAPRGLALNFFNPVPWLFTLPIPLAVVAASAGTIAWTLSRLAPVSIIERR